MMIRSPSNSNELSDLISHHNSREVRKWRFDLASEVVADLFVATPPRARLVERLARCLAMTYDARGAKLEAMRMDSIHLDQANPLVGIPLADLGPGHGLRDRWRERCGSIHCAILCRMVGLSSSLPAPTCRRSCRCRPLVAFAWLCLENPLDRFVEVVPSGVAPRRGTTQGATGAIQAINPAMSSPRKSRPSAANPTAAGRP